MTGVSTVPPQVSDSWRRLSGAPNWPLVSACLLALAAIVELRLRTAGLGDLSSDWEVGLQFALVSTLPVALRRTRYLPVALAIVTLANSVQLAGTEDWTVAAIAAELWLLYETSLRYSRWLWIGACFALLVGALSSAGSNQAVIFPDGSADTGPSAPPGEIVILLAVGVSLLGDARRLRSHTIVERDEARESAAASQHEQAIMEERARIARELHDVVAHDVSMISVQAETARLTTPGMPEEGKERLQAIGQTARDALAELRRVLGVLRADDDEAERTPQPGLARLTELVTAARSSGTQVRLTVDGPAAPLLPGVDLTAYRIVQEALTNARRHAPGAHVEVGVRYSDETLRVRVRDYGPGLSPTARDGHGLVGMRERAVMVGGTLETGPAYGGGFLVDANLPLRGEAS